VGLDDARRPSKVPPPEAPKIAWAAPIPGFERMEIVDNTPVRFVNRRARRTPGGTADCAYVLGAIFFPHLSAAHSPILAKNLARLGARPVPVRHRALTAHWSTF